MGCREKGKRFLAEIFYGLYRIGILKNPLHVSDLDSTIEELLATEKSFVRFGDGEIRLIEGESLPLQKANPELALRLKEIISFESDKLIIGIPDIFGSLSRYRRESRIFWKEHLLFYRKKYEKYCGSQIRYYDAFFSRLYYMYHDRELSRQRFEKIKKIWASKDLAVIESKSSHIGVDNDLLVGARSVKRIICPEENAFAVYDVILHGALEYPPGTMFLLSAGASAKLLAVDLTRAGYRALDIGSLDMEYQWYCMNAEEKCHPPKKNCMTRQQDMQAGYYEYLEQIDVMIDRNGNKKEI